MLRKTKEGYPYEAFIYCCCGCGKTLAKYNKYRGLNMCIPSHKWNNSLGNRFGENNKHWKGGKKITKDGYIQIKKRDHHFADANGYVLEHRLVMEQHLGRYLTEDEIVHHKDNDKKNNKIENLEVMTQSQHFTLHKKMSNPPSISI